MLKNQLWVRLMKSIMQKMFDIHYFRKPLVFFWWHVSCSVWLSTFWKIQQYTNWFRNINISMVKMQKQSVFSCWSVISLLFTKEKSIESKNRLDVFHLRISARRCNFKVLAYSRTRHFLLGTSSMNIRRYSVWEMSCIDILSEKCF